MRATAILVRVAPEILDRMKSGDVEPVVMLGVDEQPDGTYDMTLKRPALPTVAGACPACGGSLFLADGGYVTCTYNDCPDPGAPSDALGG